MKNNKLNAEASPVNDKWIFVLLYPVMAISIVHIGNDNSLSKLLTIPSYYSDLLLAFGCTFSVGLYFKWFFNRINQKFDWGNQFKQRLFHQAIWGIAIPTVFIICIELIYLSLIHVDLNESSIFYLELPLVALFCALINLIYFILYYRKHNLDILTTLDDTRSKVDKDYFIAKSGAQAVKIPKSKISYFIVQGKVTFLATTEGKKYVYDFPLKELASSVSPNDFFQLNRQILANRNSILKYHQTPTRRLEIELSPASNQKVFLAKTKASEFAEWLAHK